MTNEDIKKEFGLIVEEEWINKWGSEVFPRLEYTKHEDKYNKVDAWVKHLETGKTKRMQLKVIVPMRKSRSITIKRKQWETYINDGVDLLYHISPIEYPNEFGKEDVRIELRCIDIQKLETEISHTNLGIRVEIKLEQMNKFELPLEFQMWIDDLYDKMMRPTEYGYYTKKKFKLKDVSPTNDLVVKKKSKSKYRGQSICSTTHTSKWNSSDVPRWKKEFPYNTF
jgi:hypothetical protein